MNVVAFALGLAATAAMLSCVAAVVVGAAALVINWSNINSARRADLALLGGLLPLVVAGFGTVLVALPSLLSAAGVWPDHCVQHGHHWHLCPTHIVGVPAWVAVVGAVALVAASARAGLHLLDQHRGEQLLQASAQVGVRAVVDGVSVVVVDGPPTLLHAASDFIIASRSLLDGLSGVVRRAALQHEAAHVRRGDSTWLRLLSIAGACAPPLFGAWMSRVYRQAAEEAADEEAAFVVGTVDVAAAIVEVSRARRRSVLETLPAIDGANLERRVLRLLALTPRQHRSGAVVVLAVLALGAMIAAPFFDDVHHGAETVLAHINTTHHNH